MNDSEKEVVEARPIELHMLHVMIAGFIQRHDLTKPADSYCRLIEGDLDTDKQQFTFYYEWVSYPQDRDEEDEEEDVDL